MKISAALAPTPILAKTTAAPQDLPRDSFQQSLSRETPFQPFKPQELTREATRTALFNVGVAQLHSVVDQDLALQKTAGPDGLFLQPNSESIVMTQPGPDAKGTVVMFHGFTAAPWQYKEMAKQYFDAGYNVFVPRMPGHGFCDATGKPTGKNIPDSCHRDEWKQFAEKSYEQASHLMAPVFAIGLSGGADVALSVGAAHPEMGGVAAVSPYLGGNPGLGTIFPVMDVLDRVTFGLVGRVLDHIPFGPNPRVPDSPTPHTRGSFGQALVMQEVGADIKHIACPVQMISTDGDKLSGSWRDASLFERVGGEEKNGWFRFRHDEMVPHAMVSSLENPNRSSVETVESTIFNFIDKGILTQRH